MSLKYGPSSEPLHISAKQMAWMNFSHAVAVLEQELLQKRFTVANTIPSCGEFRCQNAISFTEGDHESRRCSRDTYPELYITKYTGIRISNKRGALSCRMMKGRECWPGSTSRTRPPRSLPSPRRCRPSANQPKSLNSSLKINLETLIPRI